MMSHRVPLGAIAVLSLSMLVGCKGSDEAGASSSGAAASTSGEKQGPKFDKELYRAAENGNRSGVEYRLEAGADINAANPDNGWTPLHAAAYYGHKKLVAYMLTRGANANAQDKEGNTPLHLAASRGHEDTTAALVASTDLSRRNNAGKTAREVATPRALIYIPAT